MNDDDIRRDNDYIDAALKPVIGAEKYHIAGYEVIGCLQKNGDTIPLKAFFDSAENDMALKWQTDKQLYRLAAEKLLERESSAKLFMNMLPEVFTELDAIEDLMELLQEFHEWGLQPSQFVVEINSAGLEGRLDELSHSILYLKASGYEVSLDNIKIADTHLEQFAKLEPNIIKIDVSDLRTSSSYTTYSEILDTLSYFARKIGSSLHFKGIEDAEQFHVAWRYGGYYYQGEYIGKDVHEVVESSSFEQSVRADIHSFIDRHSRRLKNEREFVKNMDDKLRQLVHTKDSEKMMKEASKTFHAEAFRMYICDEYGYQMSANWTKRSGDWEQNKEAKGKNWSWRVYFLDHMSRMAFNRNGMLSDKYRDIETNELILTYSHPLQSEQFLFIDIDPIYLYEKNWFI
ncbi:EAL-associated domain-containing protein [Alkalicoccus luteus]|uniref:EAL domain-containing protein n=1 Tax=Alkalicoccus luteus TaxID=1237094 RepID=A0A969TWE7_9BACI|nr:EAL-associated domain-containing protein [Alkalicoccus luteus]NJP37224.1 EAL domain-containing protein [Alkalicoccus luteus]